jgi:hypothetical protein
MTQKKRALPNRGDRRPVSELPGYEPDWRDPRNMQFYTEPMLELEKLLNLQEYPAFNVQEYADKLRLLRSHEVAAAFSLMMGLADDRLVSLADDLALCDAETPTARGYQAAIEVLRAYYFDKRLKVEPVYLVAARIIAQCVDVELLARDLPQKKRELSALANSASKLQALADGKLIRLSPGTFNVVPFMLAGHSLLKLSLRVVRSRSKRFAASSWSVGTVQVLRARDAEKHQ